MLRGAADAMLIASSRMMVLVVIIKFKVPNVLLKFISTTNTVGLKRVLLYGDLEQCSWKQQYL